MNLLKTGSHVVIISNYKQHESRSIKFQEQRDQNLYLRSTLYLTLLTYAFFVLKKIKSS